MVYEGTPLRSAFRTFDSYTIPNASCPVCGASVFFYQSPTGGRVFFDELGPPWPKHPCTIAATAAITTRVSSGKQRTSMPTWVRAGWIPVLIQSSRMKDAWHCLPMQLLDRGVHVEALTTDPVIVRGQMCAMLRSYDADGVGLLSILDLDAAARARTLMVFEPRRYAGRSPFVTGQRVRSARRYADGL